MTDQYALVPVDASSEEIEFAGVDPDAKRFVPFLGYIHSDDVDIWVGITAISGMISLNSVAPGELRAWVTQGSDQGLVFVNTSRLFAVRM